MKKINWNYTKNPHQLEFHNDVVSRRLHLSTGFGGGKTYALVMKAFQLSWLNRHVAGGLVAESFQEFKKDWLPLFEEILDNNKISFQYKANGKYGPYFTWPWTDAPIFVQSGEKKIRGPNWGWACINELTLMPLIRYQEVFGRVRVKKAKFPQIASCGTPEGHANEYYDYLIENPPPNTRIIYGNSKDNQQNLGEGFIQDLEHTYDSVMQDAYVRGLWVNMSTNRFYYAYDPSRNDIKEGQFKRRDYDYFHIGMDFNVDNMAANIWQYDGHVLWGVDEITIPKNAETRDMAKALISRGYTPENSILYPDPAGNSRKTTGKPDIVVLRDCGFEEIRVKKRAATHRQRQLHMNNLLEKGRIRPNPQTQPEVKKDFQGVEMDPIRLEKNKDNPKRTHHSDGVDYLCEILMPFKPVRERIFQGVRQ